MASSDWDYRGLVAESYDLWFGAEPFWDQNFFHNRIRHNDGVALEVACGTGRLLVPFLCDGLAVEGVDASLEMLAICREKAAHMGVTLSLYQQFMQDLELPSRYRTMFIPTCSFQILARSALAPLCVPIRPVQPALRTIDADDGFGYAIIEWLKLGV